MRPEDYIATAEYQPEAMYRAILELADGFSDRDLAELLKAVFAKYKTELLLYPAAVRLHHAMQGGLLYHTLSILRLCQQVAKLYPTVDEGNLLGHLVVGAMMVRDVAKEIGTPEDKVVLVEHMLISHHGKPEFGAAVPPKFLEAIILSKLDELDATIYEVCETYTNVEAGEFSSRLWNFDNIAIYNPGRADRPEPVAKLFDTED